MATTTICDLCEEAPRAEGESHSPTAATWVARLRTKTGVEVSTAVSLDACNYHLAKAVGDLSVRPAAKGEAFLDILVERLP
jgi:hypothetical protein